MDTSSQEITKHLLSELDRLAYRVSIILMIVLIGVYYLLWEYVPPNTRFTFVRDLGLSLITNFIPIFLVFAASYVLFRKIQEIKSSQETSDTIRGIVEQTNNHLSQPLAAIEEKLDLVTALTRDSRQKGIERICTKAESDEFGEEEMRKTDVLKVIGIGNSWLLREPHFSIFKSLLENNRPVTLLLPDPLSEAIQDRYLHDEPDSAKLNLRGLAEILLEWVELGRKYRTLTLKAYDRYPMATVSIYSHRVFASPVLYQRRGVENLTVIFRRPSIGSGTYEDHFNKVFKTGSVDITPHYLAKLRQEYNL